MAGTGLFGYKQDVPFPGRQRLPKHWAALIGAFCSGNWLYFVKAWMKNSVPPCKGRANR